jgi:hypothetical protein
MTSPPVAQDPALDVGGRFAMAFAAGDASAIGPLLADDAVLHSPITDRFDFEGREAVLHVLGAAMATLDDRSYDTPLLAGGQVALRLSARVRSRPVDAVTVLDVSADGLIRKIKVFVRPLPGLAAFAAAMVPLVSRPGGRAASTGTALLLRPLVPIIRGGERLVLPAVRRGVRSAKSNAARSPN